MEFFALSWGSLSIYCVTLDVDGTLLLFEKTFVSREALAAGWTRGLGPIPREECRQPALCFDPDVFDSGLGLQHHILWGGDPDLVFGFGVYGTANICDVQSRWGTAGHVVAMTYEEESLQEIARRTPIDGCPILTDDIRKDILRLNWAQSRRIILELDALPAESPFFLATRGTRGEPVRFRLTEEFQAAAAAEA